MKTTHSKHKRTISFTAYEDNDVTFQLVNPGSDRTGTDPEISTIYSNRYTDFMIGFETREGETVLRKYVETAGLAEPVTGVKDSETEPKRYPVKVVLYPDGEGLLYTTLKGADPAGS